MKFFRWRNLAVGVLVSTWVCGCVSTAQPGDVWVPMPGTWEEVAIRMRAGKPGHESAPTTKSLEYHSQGAMGFTLRRVKFTIDAAVLEKLLGEAAESDVYFTTDYDIDHAFGPDSNKTSDFGTNRSDRLPWWQPWGEPQPSYYEWFMHDPGKTPKTYVWLQVSEGRQGRKLVYMRIEIQ